MHVIHCLLLKHLPAREEPLIHIHHPQMRKLTAIPLGKIVDQKFIKEMVLTDFINVDVTKSHKYNARPEMGTKTNIFLSKLDNLQRKKFEDEVATPFYASSTKYLLDKLPLDNQLILDVKYLH